MNKKRISVLLVGVILLMLSALAFLHWNARNPESYVGMSEQAAIVRAEKYDVDYRLVRKDDEHFVLTMDLRPDRINFEVDNDRITKAYSG